MAPMVKPEILRHVAALEQFEFLIVNRWKPVRKCRLGLRG
jgi:hypothetical protein